MSQIILTDQQMNHCDEVAQQRLSSDGKKSRYFSGDKYERGRQGCRGELAVRLWARAPPVLTSQIRGDRGVDLEWMGLRWSIKYTELSNPRWVMVRGDLYKPGVTDIVVQCRMGTYSPDGSGYARNKDPRAVILMGWMPDEIFYHYANHDGKHYNAYYCAIRPHLSPMARLKAFTNTVAAEPQGELF